MKLDHDQYLRIYAALVALGVQRLMLDYLPAERAWHIADEVRRAVLDRQRQNPDLSQDFLTRRLLHPLQEPGGEVPSELASDPLEKALDSYDESVALAAPGQLSADIEDGQTLLRQAQLCFQRAAAALKNLPAGVL